MAHTIYAERFFSRHAEVFAPYLVEAGLDERILDDPATEIPVERYVALWELLGRKLDASIGLKIAMQSDSSLLGAFGHAVRSAPTMQLVLRCLSRYIVVFCHTTRLDVIDDRSQIILSYQVTNPAIIPRRQDAEFSLGLFLILLREVTGTELLPRRVDFEHAQPADVCLHRKLFACPMYFNQMDNRLYFPKEFLDMPISTADSRLFQGLEPFLEQQRQRRKVATDLLGTLRHHIASNLSSGDASLEEVASSLRMSQRTLQRRLAEHQLEFGNVVEQVRRSLAETYLAQTGYSLAEIALLLGYAESSSFSRAFRRWTRLSPSQYRRQCQVTSC